MTSNKWVQQRLVFPARAARSARAPLPAAATTPAPSLAREPTSQQRLSIHRYIKRVLGKRPLGKAQAAKLNIHSWSTGERLHYFTEGRFLKELYADSLVLAPLEPRTGKGRAPTTRAPGVQVSTGRTVPVART
jgi:hypothetical protein